MVKNLKIMLVFSLFISLFISCTKDIEPALPVEPDDVESTVPDETEDETPAKPGQSQDAYEMGTGSGDLTIDGSDEAVNGKKLIIIKAGSYGNISIRNLKGTVSDPVVIKNGGQVSITKEMDISSVNNVIISGDNVPSIPYGFNFHNISYRSMYMGSKINGLTIQYMSFKNVGDYVIHSTAGDDPYTGTVDSRTEGLKILHNKFDNASSISFGGSFGRSADLGFVNNLEIAHNVIENSSSGSIAYFGNVQNYDIHHNKVNNFNLNNNNHNGVFFMKGAGKFHDNKFTNYQGNTIRAWLYARVSDPVTVEFYNNVAYNTTKYGAFELQGFEDYIVPGKTTYANAKVYNNTAGKMNTTKDWQGLMLDVYNYGGTLEFYNNLGFDMYDISGTVHNLLNNMSSVKIIKNTNNKYFSKSSEAVNDINSLSSKHSGIGAMLKL